MTYDLKDFFLASSMTKPKYMKVPITTIPNDIISKYNLKNIATTTNQIYICIKKGMYGLKQAAVLAYDNLIKNLRPHGYAPIPHTVGLWKHKERKISFCLCVDDFGIKYHNKEDAYHLLQALQVNYKTSVDLSGNQFCGLHLTWNYAHAVMSTYPCQHTYIPSLLKKLPYTPTFPQYSPHPATPFQLARQGTRQFATPPDTSPALDKILTTKVQSIVGSLLYYARAVDCSMLPALNSLSSQQSSPTENTLKLCHTAFWTTPLRILMPAFVSMPTI